MTRKAFTPEGLATAAGVPLTSVYNFFNASALCGFLQQVHTAPSQPQPVQSVPADSLMGGMLRRIRHAFSMHSAVV